LVADGVVGITKAELPVKLRFFRRQMNNMIAKAMRQAALASRRTLAPLPMAATTDGGGVS